MHEATTKAPHRTHTKPSPKHLQVQIFRRRSERVSVLRVKKVSAWTMA